MLWLSDGMELMGFGLPRVLARSLSRIHGNIILRLSIVGSGREKSAIRMLAKLVLQDERPHHRLPPSKCGKSTTALNSKSNQAAINFSIAFSGGTLSVILCEASVTSAVYAQRLRNLSPLNELSAATLRRTRQPKNYTRSLCAWVGVVWFVDFIDGIETDVRLKDVEKRRWELQRLHKKVPSPKPKACA